MSTIKIVLNNPEKKNNEIDYTIDVYDTLLSDDWISTLKNDILLPELKLDKEYCFLGFPHTHRSLGILCDELNAHIETINIFNGTGIWTNNGLAPYVIEEYFSTNSVRFDSNYPVAPHDGSSDHDDDPAYLGLKIKHDIMNRLHNHFERLQGTMCEPSQYYKLASDNVKHAIRSLNLLCHEVESLVLSQRKLVQNPQWVRPSQITTFINAPRIDLTSEHRLQFDNKFDRKLGEVYMHWCQVGKTLIEVFRDEHAPIITVGSNPTDITVGAGTTCEAINALRYYSGEFDIEWGRDVVYKDHKWHKNEIDSFYHWLTMNNIDYTNPDLSLGFLPMAQVNLLSSFGTTSPEEIWKILGSHLDIKSIECDGLAVTYDYNDRHVKGS